MKQLVIAEKPSVARDLAKVLGATQKNKNYIEGKQVVVTWALGHLLGLKMPEDYHPEWKKWSMDTLPMIPKKTGIKPLPKTGAQLKTIKQLSKRNDIKEVIIATDAGREGELVARWILEYVNFKKPVKRLWISSQTDKAIKQGFNQLKPSREYDNLYESALARAKADWLVGLNVTRALTVKYEDNLSAGRVQTPTLALVRKQERKQETFKPQVYFIIDYLYAQQKGRMQMKNPFAFKKREQAEKLVEELLQRKGKVVAINKKQKTQSAPLPYDLTEIQREANQRYHYSAKQTLGIVQNLYETHKIVTYPRTDSKYLTTDMKSTMKERLAAIAGAFPEARKFLKTGSNVVQQKVFQNNKVTDHHALIPTEQMPNFSHLDQGEQRIYQMIVERFLGLFAQPYVEEIIEGKVTVGKEVFLFNQSHVKEWGWKHHDTAVKDDSITMDWQVGQTLPTKFVIEQKNTTPPSALNEASLLGKMEHFGLGTPATRAEIIEKLIKTELMERTQNRLLVTPKGKQLLELVNPALVTPELTASWEKELEAIAHGQLKQQVFLKGIERKTTELVKEIKNSTKKYQDFSLTQKRCPECGELLKERNTRDGKRLVCTNSECNYQRRKDPKISNHRCPQCHKKMEILQGKNGAYFKCKYCNITEKMGDKKTHKQKMTKHEEKKLMKKYSQSEPVEESSLAQALKAALGNKNE